MRLSDWARATYGPGTYRADGATVYRWSASVGTWVAVGPVPHGLCVVRIPLAALDLPSASESWVCDSARAAAVQAAIEQWKAAVEEVRRQVGEGGGALGARVRQPS